MHLSAENPTHRLHRPVAAVLVAGLLSGCATLMSGDPQTVRVTTQPPGRTVYFQGSRVSDGEHLTVTRRFRTPQFNVGTPEMPVPADLAYSVQPWVIGDAGLALFFLLPGLIAGGIDAGTGAWRKLDDPQVVTFPAPSSPAEQAAPAPSPSPASTDASDRKASTASSSSSSSSRPPKAASPSKTIVTDSAAAAPLSVEEGVVSWYELGEAGRLTASGEPFDSERLAAAHRTLPFGSVVRVTRLDTQQSVEVVVNDRGPRVEGRILDVTRGAASRLGLIDIGLAPCRVEVLQIPGR